MILKWQLVEVSCSHTTVAVGGQTAIPQLENLKKSRVPFFVNKHSTETRCRASSVTMRVGQRITAIKNRKLAEHRKQNLLTDKSECKCLKSTRFNSCTALKWSTKTEHVQDLTLIILVDTACSRGEKRIKVINFQCNTFRWPQFDWCLKQFEPSANVEVMERPISHLWLLPGEQCRFQ